MSSDVTETQPPTEPPEPPGPRKPAAPEQRIAGHVGPPGDPDRYELIGPPLRGGEGLIWRARHTPGEGGDSVPLAVKELLPPAHADVRRLESSRIVLTSLRAPHLVPVVDVFAAGATPYLVMPWIEGPTLTAHLRDDLPLDERLTLITQLARAVGALHAKATIGGAPLVHRDIKPDNCILSPTEGLMLVDISTLRSVLDGYDPVGLRSVAWAAPEVLADPRAARSPASDIFSLGAVAFFCLTGARPPSPAAPTYLADAEQRLTTAVAAFGLADPAAFVRHVLLPLDPDPAARPTDAAAWAGQLPPLAAPARSRRRRRVLLSLLALLLVVGIGGGAAAVVVDKRQKPAPTFMNSATATITSPKPLGTVARCNEIDGTSHLRPGQSLITTMRNIDNGEIQEWPVFIHGWGDPSTLQKWYGLQYFGPADRSVGETYIVKVYAVPLTELQSIDKETNQQFSITSPPKTWQLAAWILVKRIAGSGVC